MRQSQSWIATRKLCAAISSPLNRIAATMANTAITARLAKGPRSWSSLPRQLA